MRQLAICSGAFAVAVLCAVLAIPTTIWLPLCVCMGGATVVLTRLPRKWGSRNSILLLVAMGISAGFGSTALWTQVYYTPATEMVGAPRTIEAEVLDWPQQSNYGYSVLVRLSIDGAPDAKTILYIGEEGSELRPADTVTGFAELQMADYNFSGEKVTYYLAKGILLTGKVYGALEWTRPERPSPMHIPAYLSRALKDGIADAFSEQNAPFVQAVVTGNRDNLTDAFTTSLQRAGLSHTVAVSGMHMAFLAGALALILGRYHRRTSLIVIPIVLVFMMVAGNTPSVVRASIMIIMLHIAPLVGRERDTVTALMFALLLILIQNPYAITNVGLQLSFTSVAGILAVSEPLQARMERALHLPWGEEKDRRLSAVSRFVRGIACAISISVGAMIFTTPLVAHYFGTVSLISPLANLLTLWAIALVFAWGLFCGCLGVILPTVAGFFGMLLTPVMGYLDWAIPTLGRIPFATLPANSFYSTTWLVFVYLLVIGWMVFPGKRKLLPVVCVALLTLASSIALHHVTYYMDAMTVSVLDVGQGQSVLLRVDDQVALVDCGGSEGVNAGVTAAGELASMGKYELDYLILTHGHSDHANGAVTLMKNITVGELYLPDIELENDLTSEILAEAERQGITVHRIDTTTYVPMGDAGEITIFPPMDDNETNEQGISVLCSVGEEDVFITGDIGSESEEKLIECADFPKIEIFVAGHHGSDGSNSTALLEEIQPNITIISAGRGNRYGHPDDDTLRRLDACGTEIYRTDLMGRITIRIAKE